MSHKYILLGKQPILEPDLLKWALWFEESNRRVMTDIMYVMHKKRVMRIVISTVFLGLDMGWKQDAPLIFETMIFGGPMDGDLDRCDTWDHAEGMHLQAVSEVTNAMRDTYRILCSCRINTDYSGGEIRTGSLIYVSRTASSHGGRRGKSKHLASPIYRPG